LIWLSAQPPLGLAPGNNAAEDSRISATDQFKCPMEFRSRNAHHSRVAASFTGNQIACFAIRTCTLSSGGDLGTCVGYGGWGFRPEVGTGHGLQIKVVIKFTAVTPALAQIAGAASMGIIYLVQTSTAEELYY